MAEVTLVETNGMPASERCDRCGGQAFVQVALKVGGTLLFCAHHATEHDDKLKTLDATITDHRPFLAAEEQKATALHK